MFSHRVFLVTDAPALSVTKLSHAYGARKALDDVSFSLERGSFAVLLGLNGAGKSTLFSLVTGLYSAGFGRVDIFGFDIAKQPGEALRRLGVVFQARTLDLELSVTQNLLYHAALHGIGYVNGKRLARELLERAGLGDRAGDKARDLSGGQMRRVEIARALLHAPKLLLLDEPTVGLDIKARADILAHVRELVKREGLAVLWTTHLIDEIEPGDRVIVLHQGKMLANGTAAEIVSAQGVATIGEAFESSDGGRERAATGDIDDHISCSTRRFHSRAIRHLPRRDRLARGFALPASARALRLGAGAAARLAVHLRGGVSLGAGRVDHPALRHLCAL